MTASSYAGWKRKKPRRAGSLSRIRLKKNLKRVKVMAIGAGKIEKCHRVPLDVKVGDRIFFGKYTDNDIKINAQE
jgi:co-chaperonin GroES (HSP10)